MVDQWGSNIFTSAPIHINTLIERQDNIIYIYVLLLQEKEAIKKDWVHGLDLSGAKSLLGTHDPPPQVLVLYGSLRTRAYSRLLAYEMARVLDYLGEWIREL